MMHPEPCDLGTENEDSGVRSLGNGADCRRVKLERPWFSPCLESRANTWIKSLRPVRLARWAMVLYSPRCSSAAHARPGKTKNDPALAPILEPGNAGAFARHLAHAGRAVLRAQPSHPAQGEPP